MAGNNGDRVLEAFQLAADIWSHTIMAEKLEKLEYAEKLHPLGVFSLPQIAKIVRLNSRYIYEKFEPNSPKGGRFEPATLSTLVRIRRLFLNGEDIPHNLIRLGIQGGTSYTCLTALTRIPYSKYYEVARAQRVEREKSPTLNTPSRLDQDQRASVLALRAKGLTQNEIAFATGLDQPLVSRILRGLR